jgi:hypothetical protein
MRCCHEQVQVLKPMQLLQLALQLLLALAQC